MTASDFNPTNQQRDIIHHAGCAFVTACPGAGKTRTMVERAREILDGGADGRGIAFLSFTNAAVYELETRLRSFGILPTPLFPSFIGTFDRFLWQFFIAPFGLEGCSVTPRLIPDKDNWPVIPFPNAHALPLKCFDRLTGKVDADLAKDEGFDVTKRSVQAHETAALTLIANAHSKGLIDFEDVRLSVRTRLSDDKFAKRLGAALTARFGEMFVDEAQDCNPADLEIVDWLRVSGIAVKVICDPNQSIYQFRGGVTHQLLNFADTFGAPERLEMNGNFRSTPAICSAIVALRSPTARSNPDQPLGRYKTDTTPVHIVSYAGSGVSSGIGREVKRIADGLNIPLEDVPVLASTRSSAAKAIGQPLLGQTGHMTMRLAEAVTNYHFSFAIGNRRDALVKLHRVIMLIQEHIGHIGDYDRFIEAGDLADGRWRPSVIQIANALRFDPLETSDKWLDKARALLAPGLAGTSTINQRLRNTTDLGPALKGAPDDSPPARTIHSVKGLEFPGVCVVLTSQKAGAILDLLEGSTTTGVDEDVRKIYVGASRAQRLLVLAVPKSQAARLLALLKKVGCDVVLHQI